MTGGSGQHDSGAGWVVLVSAVRELQCGRGADLAVVSQICLLQGAGVGLLRMRWYFTLVPDII